MSSPDTQRILDRLAAAEVETKRIAEQLDKIYRLVAGLSGHCPACGRHVRNWGSNWLPESAAEIRKNGIDPNTGHLLTCVET